MTSSRCTRRTDALAGIARALVLLSALMLGSCTFLADEFSWLDRAGSVAGPQQEPPSATSDRS